MHCSHDDDVRILVLEQELLISRLLEDAFASQRWLVDCVTTSTDALRLLGERSYALVTTPVTGAPEFFDLVVEGEIQNRWPKLDVMVVSAHGGARVRERAWKAGATFLSKPCEREEVLHAANKIFEIRGLRRKIDRIRADLRRLADS